MSVNYHHYFDSDELFQDICIDEFNLDADLEEFEPVIIHGIHRDALDSHSYLCSVDMSLTIEYNCIELLPINYGSEYGFCESLTDFSLIEVTKPTMIPVAIRDLKREHLLQFKYKSKYHRAQIETIIYFDNEKDMCTCLKSIMYLNYLRIKKVKAANDLSISYCEQLKADTNLLEKINTITTDVFYDPIKLLRDRESYCEFILSCLLICENSSLVDTSKVKLINKACSMTLSASFNFYFWKNSHLSDLHRLLEIRYEIDSLCAVFCVYRLVEQSINLWIGQNCPLYSIAFEKKNSLACTPYDIIEYYIVNSCDKSIDRDALRLLLACFLLQNIYKERPEEAITLFWTDVEKCKFNLLNEDRLPRNIGQNSFAIWLQNENSRIQDEASQLVSKKKKQVEDLVCKITSSEILVSAINLVKMLPKQIRTDIVSYSDFIEDILIRYVDFTNELYDELGQQNEYSKWNSHLSKPYYLFRSQVPEPTLEESRDLFEKYKVFLEKRFDISEDIVPFVTLGVINAGMLKVAGSDAEIYSLEKLSTDNLKQHILQLIYDGTLLIDETTSFSKYVFVLYAMQIRSSFLQIPMSDQYQDLIDAFIACIEEITQNDFEKELFQDLHTKRRLSYLITEIDRLSGQEFERVVADIFENMGYTVQLTPASNDLGVDVLAQRVFNKHHEKVGIQVKRYSGAVGNSAIQEIVAAKDYYGLNTLYVVTNSYFTRSALKLAAANEVVLWDRDVLIKQLAWLTDKDNAPF